MKSLIFSLCALILLVGIIILNGVYIKNVTTDLENLAKKIAWQDMESIDAFKASWEENEHKICLSVSHKDIDNVNIAVSVLEEKQKTGEKDAFYEYRALLLGYVTEIKNKERVHIDNIV